MHTHTLTVLQPADDFEHTQTLTYFCIFSQSTIHNYIFNFFVVKYWSLFLIAGTLLLFQ